MVVCERVHLVSGRCWRYDDQRNHLLFWGERSWLFTVHASIELWIIRQCCRRWIDSMQHVEQHGKYILHADVWREKRRKKYTICRTTQAEKLHISHHASPPPSSIATATTCGGERSITHPLLAAQTSLFVGAWFVVNTLEREKKRPKEKKAPKISNKNIQFFFFSWTYKSRKLVVNTPNCTNLWLLGGSMGIVCSFWQLSRLICLKQAENNNKP